MTITRKRSFRRCLFTPNLNIFNLHRSANKHNVKIHVLAYSHNDGGSNTFLNIEYLQNKVEPGPESAGDENIHRAIRIIQFNSEKQVYSTTVWISFVYIIFYFYCGLNKSQEPNFMKRFELFYVRLITRFLNWTLSYNEQNKHNKLSS